jgi:hypothetical protein
MLFLELKDSATFGICHYPKDKVSYFRVDKRLGRQERVAFVQEIYAGAIPSSLVSLSVDKFLQSIESKKARHIWLETLEPERKEHAFLSVSELKTFLKSWRNH